jgi:hypothetical protein
MTSPALAIRATLTGARTKSGRATIRRCVVLPGSNSGPATAASHAGALA